jgi:stearoyl-CoA desaturase (delta-9 desaturase)
LENEMHGSHQIMATTNNKRVGPSVDNVIASPALRRWQSLMTTLVVGIPLLGTAAAVVWLFFHSIALIEVALLGFMWIVTGGLGIEVGYHRFLVHRSFEAPAAVRLLLASAGAMALQGPPLYWSAIHRRHHELSDAPGDPHTPNIGCAGLFGRLRGIWHAHIGWMTSHPVPNTLHYVPDLVKDPVVRWVNRYYLLIAVGGLVLPAAISGAIHQSWEGVVAGFLWGGLVRVLLASNATWSVNSICHAFGSRPFNTDDDSRNVALLAIPTFGESWHNNHHAFPTLARAGLHWWQLDLAYLMIWVMARLGLVTAVRVKPRADGHAEELGREGDNV